MPYSKHDIMVPPPLGILANYSIKLKSVAKMRTGPPPQENQDVGRLGHLTQIACQKADTR